MKWMSRVVVVAVVIVLVAGVYAALRPRPLAVDAARVTRAPFEQIVVDDGIARVRERYIVYAPVAGTLTRISLHEGDVVEPDAVLVRLLPLPSPLLDPRSHDIAEQRLASAVDAGRQVAATVERAEAAAGQSHRELDRVGGLADHGAVPFEELDRAQSDARVHDAELSSARFAAQVADHEVLEARAALRTFAAGSHEDKPFDVTSPVHGQVLHVLHQSEGAVAIGTPLLELGDPQVLELAVDVLSQDAVALRAGMIARVIHWGGDAPLVAKVRRVEPSAFTKTSALGVDEQRVDVLLDPQGSRESWRELGDGFRVEVEIVVWTRPDVVQVPTSAVFRHGEGWALFAIRDGRAELRDVELGHRGPLATEVVHGVDPGGDVIAHPGALVRDGADVVAR